MLLTVDRDAQGAEQHCGPWNPGLESALPAEFLPLATVFRPENVAASLGTVHELGDFSGIPMQDLVEFRPERLAVHELLIRVIADLSVADGAKYEDLGTNFRRMTAAILSKFIMPEMDGINRLHAGLRVQIANIVGQELAACFERVQPAAGTRERSGLFARFGSGAKSRPAPVSPETAEERDFRIVAAWQSKAETAKSGLERSIYQTLLRIAAAIRRKHGQIIGDAGVLSALAIPMVLNEHGSEMIGEYIEPHISSAAEAEGYHFLPFQTHPVIMNVKGASASGKSTMRPLQKQLAKRLGIRWEEFALISPDIWRKFLLDYNSLGPARKYAGTLTGHEVAIIDRKLDRYMTRKGEGGRLPHLLIDRFRFDSFTADPDGCSQFVTRFGNRIYVFFMITPPEATVERAWKRGERFGRYKAVDDLLYHNIEAYTGMPRLFFEWAAKQAKQVHFEFLDNGVPKGCPPKTVAYGTNSELNVLDIGRLLDIERFKNINISARRPEEVYEADLLVPEKNTGFLRKCARTIPAINFAEAGSGRIFAKVTGGRLMIDERPPADPDTKAGLAAVAAEFFRHSSAKGEELGALTPGQATTLGAWGDGRAG